MSFDHEPAVAAATILARRRRSSLDGSEPGFPTLVAAQEAREAQWVNFDGADDEVVRLHEDGVLQLIRQMAGTVTSRVKQIMPLNTSGNDLAHPLNRHRSLFRRPAADSSAEFTQVVTETLARLGKDISCLYLVPPGGPRSDRVNDRVSTDLASGVKSRSLWISQIDTDLPELASQTPVCPVWIVDDAAVVFQEATEEDSTVWKVSARTDDVQRVERLFDSLWTHAERMKISADEDEINLRDPLLLGVEQMAGIARMFCTLGNGDKEPCYWYHGAWPYLRLFDMASSPQWHHKFYYFELLDQILDAPRQLQRTAPKVLITGAADYSMLAYVLNAAQRADGMPGVKRPTIEVLDLCPTPLMMCRWYAGLSRERVYVHEMDFCDSTQIKQLRETYDVIVTDAFLTRFSAQDAETVVRNWHDSLIPGGTVVTTVRLHPMDKHDGAQLTDLAAAFTQRARHSARRWRPYLRASVDEIASNAYEYATHIVSTDLGDESTVLRLFERARFDILRADVTEVRGELQPTGYLRIVAQKKAMRRRTALRVG